MTLSGMPVNAEQPVIFLGRTEEGRQPVALGGQGREGIGDRTGQVAAGIIELDGQIGCGA